MEKKNFLAVIIMVVLFSAISMNAKNVNGINTRDAQACGEYLVKNPTDTIVENFNINKEGMRGVVKRSVYLNGYRLVAFNDTTWYRQRIKNVEVSDSQVVVTSRLRAKDGSVKMDTVVWNRTSTDEVSFAQKEAICRGESRIVDPHHKDYEGNFRHRTQATLLAGGMVADGYFSPVFTGRLGYETCHWLFELEGSLSSSKYTNVAEYSGRYLSFAAQFNAGWKFLQDRRYRHFLAVLGTVGYGFQKTDGDQAVARSRNYGFVAGGMLRGSLGLTKNWRLVGEFGYKIVPKVLHNEEQDLSNGGFFANVGVGYSF